MRTLLVTELWIARSIPHRAFVNAFKRQFPHGKVVTVIDNAHPQNRIVEVETFKDEEKHLWQFFDGFAEQHGYETFRRPRALYPRPGPPFD